MKQGKVDISLHRVCVFVSPSRVWLLACLVVEKKSELSPHGRTIEATKSRLEPINTVRNDSIHLWKTKIS